MKTLCILGSTGSIGQSTLDVVARFPDRFRIRALAARKSVERLAEQCRRFRPEAAAVIDAEAADALQRLLGPNSGVEILHGEEGYRTAATLASIDTVVGAMMGAAGLKPTLAAIEAGKDIALANKETLVVAGAIVMQAAARKGVRILPVDSEHSAIFQCLSGQRRQDLSRILLTASGGPFLRTPASEFADITPEKALKHPNWQMGNKITVDSATLMNKGLEVIEACHLFDVSAENIEVVIHPQSIVHSMVSFVDGSVIAQLGMPDMKGAIAYALSYPERLDIGLFEPDFFQLGSIGFERPDLERFPCLVLAFAAVRQGGTMPAVLNAANEIAVEAFLAGRAGFTQIPAVVEKVMDRVPHTENPGLEELLEADAAAREEARCLVK
ncbi:MAG: 1-deoxy-D-xylulose-5-phosphate reductoisomerase [Desulfobacterales bacterium]|nr:1-deoxy-D-xylulose-5-phosphate reductoisomerase [Desulfobacterales bacterium]